MAWALQGIARVHQKLGEAEASQAAWAQVLSIRKATQQKSEGKVLFAEEMADAEKRVNNGCVTTAESRTRSILTRRRRQRRSCPKTTTRTSIAS